MKKITKPSLITLMILTFSIAGCASSGRKIDQSKTAQIKIGQSTKADVVALIGQPNTFASDTAGDTTLTYVYARATTKASTFIPIVGAFTGGMNMQSQSVIVHIGADGKVSKVEQSQTGMETDTGLSTGPKPVTPEVK